MSACLSPLTYCTGRFSRVRCDADSSCASVDRKIVGHSDVDKVRNRQRFWLAIFWPDAEDETRFYIES